MRRPNAAVLALLALAAVIPVSHANAQMAFHLPWQGGGQTGNSATKVTAEQFPSFAQLTSVDQFGNQTILRCGYSVSTDTKNQKVPVIDPEYHEIQILNPVTHYYSRLQRIKDVLIATFMPQNGQGLLLEMVRADGSSITKNCKTDLNNDVIANCTAAQPFTEVASIRDADQKLTPQCNELLQKGLTDFKPQLYNPEMTTSFKASFSQKINTIEAPEVKDNPKAGSSK